MLLLLLSTSLLALSFVDGSSTDEEASADGAVNESDAEDEGVEIDSDGNDERVDQEDTAEQEIETLPNIPVSIVENEAGGRDIEIELSNENAAALFDLNAGFATGPTPDNGIAGWFNTEGDQITGLPDLGVISDTDTVNVIVPDDFSFDIVPVLQTFSISGPGLQFEEITLGIFEEGTGEALDGDLANSDGLVGGPLALGSGFDFENANFLEESEQEIADVNGWLQRASELTGLPIEQISFHQIENAFSRESGDDTGARSFETPNGNVSTNLSDLPAFGVPDATGELTLLENTNAYNGDLILIAEGTDVVQRAAVVFFADEAQPEDVADGIFFVNGSPIGQLAIRQFVA